MLKISDQRYILKTVKSLVPSILTEINFTHTIKEPGHSFSGPFEDMLVNELLAVSSDFAAPTAVRSLDEISYKGQLINIKFGYKKKGQPNLCSFHRIFNRLHEDVLDSYYILSFDISGSNKYEVDYYFFDLYENLEYCSFNYGTGQLMLKEAHIKKDYSFLKKSDLTKKGKMKMLGILAEDAFKQHIALKRAQQEKIESVINGY